MNDPIKNHRKELAAAIYLKDGNLGLLKGLVSDFNRRWRTTPLVSEGEKENCAYFRKGEFHFAIEFRNSPVPLRVTESILSYNPVQRPVKKLDNHNSHFGVSASLHRGRLLDLACDFTKLIVSVLSITHAVAVCWLRGPVLCSAQEFVDVATELLSAGCPPVMLWINAECNPEAQVLHSRGMVQFQAPEILVARQSQFSKELIEYLFDIAHYVLTTNKEIADGETIDGPNGVFRIEFLNDRETGSRTLMLVPVPPN